MNSEIPILGRIIKGFPYPIKICPYCQRELTVINAIHSSGDEYNFKALYLDSNPNCPVYDEGARKAYARIYYSSDLAYTEFRSVSIPVQRWTQENLYTYYK